MDQSIGEHCPANLMSSWDVYCVRLTVSYDDEGHEQGERINGYDQCPKCGLWWPCVEQPDMWEQDDANESRWIATGWWGAAVCEVCELLMVDQPDGRGECYQL